MTLANIRKDLKEIRYYYSRKEAFDKALREVATNSILEKVEKYNRAVSTATPKLYDLYISLHVNGLTHEALAVEWGYMPLHVTRLNKKLLLFLQERLGGG